MKKRTKLAVGAGAALAVVGAGGAVAADKLSPAEESKAVVEDAAKQLGVDPAKLNDALKQALENRIDEAVEAGRLSEAQGKAMKERIEADDFPLFPGPASASAGSVTTSASATSTRPPPSSGRGGRAPRSPPRRRDARGRRRGQGQVGRGARERDRRGNDEAARRGGHGRSHHQGAA